MSTLLYPNRGQGFPNNPYVEFPPTPQSRGYPPHMSDDFISGFMEDGRMSVVRRFFCLFVTFDLVFITLLWLISVMITGDNIRNAFESQIVHYSIYTSLFDIVMAAVCRFTVLLLFYALIYMNHWIIIALSTSGSCAFLISKVFVYDWTKNQEPVFQVLLVLASFILAWGEAWFLDCRVIPQENYARSYWTPGNPVINHPASMLNPFLQSLTNSMHPESVANFYSPFESIHNSDDEDDKEEEYKEMGVECVKKAYGLLQESTDWKVEKVTNKGDTIKSTHKDRIGKVFKLTGTVNYPAKLLLKELFYNIEHVPTWNPTLLESKIVRKIDNHTDISYQATTASGGGMVKSRDFINLRCWQLFLDGKLVENYDVNTDTLSPLENEEEFSEPNSRDHLIASSLKLESNHLLSPDRDAFATLSKSLGAKNFGFDSEGFADASSNFHNHESNTHPTSHPVQIQHQNSSWQEKVYMSAAVSIDYPSVPLNTKYIRAQNIISCWAFREIQNKPNTCIFEWLLCLDLKGYIPKYVLDQSYTTFMQDYMTYLRKHVRELTAKGSVESMTEEEPRVSSA